MRNYKLIFILTVFSVPVLAQDVPLFQSREPLHLRATGSIKSIKKKTNDSTLVDGKFQYEKTQGNWTDIAVQARVRGNFRLKNCYYPPLKLKFKKSAVKGSVFEGNKALKLVLPCQKSSDNNDLIRKEYLCYQFYEELSPYHFRTRLAKLNLTETSHKKQREYDLLTFLVEDNSLVAKRCNGKIMKIQGLNPQLFEEKQAVRNDYFQYMIGNADWSAVYQHNTNVLFAEGKYITLSYDFDMAGFVDAGYAQANPPQLGTGDVKERVYRGFCRSKETMEEIRKEYLDKESEVHDLIEREASHFSSYEVTSMHDYLDEFYRILKNDNQFKMNILDGCRKSN